MAISDDLHEKLTDRAIVLDRVKGSMRQDAYSVLRDLERNLVDELYGNSPTEVRTAYQRARLEKLLKQTRATIAASYGKIRVGHARSLRGLAQNQTEYVLNELNAQVGVDIATTALSKEQINAIASNTLIQSAPSKDWWSRQAGDLQANFSDAVRQGMLRGETTDQIIRRVRGTAKNGFTDGIIHARKRHIDAIVRTSVQTVANEAGLATFESNQDVIKGLQWSSTLDGRTTKICMALHGLVWHYAPDGSLKPVGHDKSFPGPTAHWNCRSTQVPVLKSFDELAGKKVVKTGGRPTDIDTAFETELARMGMAPEKIALAKQGARASMDGYAARDLSFDAWLGKKGTAMQNRMLGKKRADLWRKKKISTRDLIDQTGRPLKVAELSNVPGTPQAAKIASLVAEGEAALAKTISTLPPPPKPVVAGTTATPTAANTVRTDLEAYKPVHRKWAELVPAKTAQKIAPPSTAYTKRVCASYSPGAARLNLRKLKDGTPEGKITFLHEWGHHAHFRTETVTFTKVESEFAAAFERAKKAIPKELKERYKAKTVSGKKLPVDYYSGLNTLRDVMRKADPDAFRRWKEVGSISERDKMFGAVWDTFAALTRGRMGGGHSRRYWKGNFPEMEAFAHAFSTIANDKGNPMWEHFFGELLEVVRRKVT